MTDVVTAMTHLGGIATRAEVIKATSRPAVERALRDGLIERVARGRYALPTASQAKREAHRLKGTAHLLSAAAHWGWTTKWQPRAPQIAVPRGRRVTPSQHQGVLISWRAIPAAAVDGWVTLPVRTVIDCAAALPFDEALAVADSALRSRDVTRAELRSAAEALPGRGRRGRVMRVVEAADARAANPFESVLRAIALDVAGLVVVPQHRIERHGKFVGRVDLADLRLRIVLEADSYEFHGERELFEKDCKRYDELVVEDWLVIRFGWTQVMTKPAWVREMMAGAVLLRERQLQTRLRADSSWADDHGCGIRATRLTRLSTISAVGAVSVVVRRRTQP
jgi:very-short-patch-repair endonuclease